MEQESRQNAEREYDDYMASKQTAKRAKAKRYDLEKEIYSLQNMLETLRKNRALVEDQNDKLEKLRIEREEQIDAMNMKI